MRIELTEDKVVWKDFEQPHRGPDSKASHWKYDALKPFIFDRKQYEDELSKYKVEFPKTTLESRLMMRAFRLLVLFGIYLLILYYVKDTNLKAFISIAGLVLLIVISNKKLNPDK